MLLDIVLACAPAVVVVPAVVALLDGQVRYRSKRHAQKRLLDSLALSEKLPAGIAGSAQIARDIDRQTLHVAYLTQYPNRAREILDIALIGIGVVVALAVYYALLWSGAALLYLLAFLALVVVSALWLERVVVNFARNDALVHELFCQFGAPENLIRPHTELVLGAPVLTIETVLERAANVRDRQDAAMSTLGAVNSVLAQAHTHGAWRRELRHLAHRVVAANYGGHAARSYDWLLWHLLRPLFKLRLTYLDDRERRRVARAEKTGDVYKAAWLATHYRNERRRLASHWWHLRRARDPLLKWSGNGASPSTPSPSPRSTAISGSR